MEHLAAPSTAPGAKCLRSWTIVVDDSDTSIGTMSDHVLRHTVEDGIHCVDMVVVISVITAPVAAAQTFTPPPMPPVTRRLDNLDQRVIELVRDEGIVPVWFPLNRIADEEAPGDRSAARAMRLALWTRLKRLFWLRLLFRVGRGLVSIAPPSPVPKGLKESRVRRRPTVRHAPGLRAVSTAISHNGAHGADQRQQVETQGTSTEILGERAAITGKETKSAGSGSDMAAAVARQIKQIIQAERVSAAAKELAALPRRPRRRWTGWFSEDWHGYRDQQVVTSDGAVRFLYGVVRGNVVITPERGKLPGGWGDGSFRWAVVSTTEVRRYLNPAAQVLGRCKAGVIERKSEAKARAARLNGLKPTRPGRKRGRPPARRNAAAKLPLVA